MDPRDQDRLTHGRNPSVAYIGDDIEAYDEKFSASETSSSDQDEEEQGENEEEESSKEQEDSGGEDFEPDKLTVNGSRRRLRCTRVAGRNVRQRK